MNVTTATLPGGPATLRILAPLATPQTPARSSVTRGRKTALHLSEPAFPGSAAAVSEWLGEIRRGSATEDRVRLVLWIVSWGALILALAS